MMWEIPLSIPIDRSRVVIFVRNLNLNVYILTTTRLLMAKMRENRLKLGILTGCLLADNYSHKTT